MKNSFFLIIPPQRKDAERIKNFQEAALKHWVEELPTANPSLVTRLFHDFIVEFNQLEMAAGLRLEALEILRPSGLVIEDYLRTRLMQSGFPKENSEQKIMDILFAIEQGFALAYWMVVRDLTSKTLGWFQSKAITLAIQRCIRCLSDVVVSFSLVYRKVPDWVWLDIHSLYALGKSLDKHTVKVHNDVSQGLKYSSIETSYHQILLFSIAQPYRLLQKEMLQTYLFLETVAPYLLIQSSIVQGQTVQCVLPMEEDKPPVFKAGAVDVTDSSLHFLDVAKIIGQFKQKQKWSAPGLVRFSTLTIPSGGNVRLSMALLEYLEQRLSGTALPVRLHFGDRLDRLVAFGLDAAFNLKHGLPASEQAEVEFLAQSASDVALLGDFNQLSGLSIGSLVSVRKVATPEALRALGVISKMVCSKLSSKVQFEMDHLAEHFFAVSFEYLDEKKDEKKPLQRKKALLYATKGQDNEEQSFIIMESFQLKDGAIIRLFMQDVDYPIIVKDRKNIGVGYWQFECRRMPETLQTLSHKPQGYDFI